MKNKTNTKSQ